MSSSLFWLRLPTLLLGLAAAWPIAAAEKPVLTHARIGVHSDMTRFVLEVSRAVRVQRVFTLSNPRRIVIDLPELAWDPSIPEQQPGKGVIERFRFGRFKPQTWRVVLVLNAPVSIQSQKTLAPSDGHGYRIFVDLVPAKPEVFERERQRARATAAAAPPVAARPPLPSTKPKRASGVRTVVIDPGHGGIDSGATRGKKIYEKHITLAVAQRIKRELEKSGRYEVLLTRDADIFKSLHERKMLAQSGPADLFISIHADSIRKSRVRGASVYTVSEKASDEEAAALAVKENKSDLLAGIDTIDFASMDPEDTYILVDMLGNAMENRAKRFSGMLVEELRNQKVKLLRKPRRSAGFVVLKAPEVASVLVELGYLSNRNDAKLLGSKRHQAKLARAMRRAVDRFFAAEISMN